MKPLLITIAVALAVSGIACNASPPEASVHPAGTTAAAASDDTSATAMASTPAAPNLQAALRGLWHGHVVEPRNYALAVKAGDTDAAGRAEQDVIANATEISDAVASFYGAAAGEKMLALLGGHLGGG